MDGDTRRLCYPWATNGELEAMSGRVFGHSFLVLTRIDASRKPLEWSPFVCEECRRPSLLSRWCWELNKCVFRDYNYRCCSACWSIIKKQLWEYLEAQIMAGPANTVWGFLVEPATRSRRHKEYLDQMSQLGWPIAFYQPLPPMAYTIRSGIKPFKGWPF